MTRGYATPERDLQKHIGEAMEGLGFVWVRYSQRGGQRCPACDRFIVRRTQQTPGIPDDEFIHPRRAFLFQVEAKSDKGRLRPEQKLYQKIKNDAGGFVIVARSVDDVTWSLWLWGFPIYRPMGQPGRRLLAQFKTFWPELVAEKLVRKA